VRDCPTNFSHSPICAISICEKENKGQSGMVCTPTIPALTRLKQEDLKLEILSQKTKDKKTNEGIRKENEDQKWHPLKNLKTG
jgi:hypothetical protein